MFYYKETEVNSAFSEKVRIITAHRQTRKALFPSGDKY